jgi:hypothetical protein
MMSSRLTPDRRRALELLATNGYGMSEELLMLGYGFSRETLADVYSGLVATERKVTTAGGKTVQFVRVRITPTGRRAIGE